MAMATDESFLRENGFTDTVDLVLATSSSSSSSSSAPSITGRDDDDAMDYNEAFPQLTSTAAFDGHGGSTFFSSAPFSTSLNGTNPSIHPSAYTLKKIEDDRRRKIAIHERLATTKIIEIPPEERLPDRQQRSAGGHQSSTVPLTPHGQPLQKFCMKIQKETSTNITFFYKEQTLIVTITGRPEQVRAAQVQILRELQQPVKLSVNIPFDFHRFIIGPRASTRIQLEQETLTRIAIPSAESQSNTILITGAKDNVKLAEQKIINIYQTQFNKGFERLAIPCLYHPWIQHQLVEELQRQFKVTIDLPPAIKQIDEISIRGERQPVELARARLMQFYQSIEGKIMSFPLEIPCSQHRFILGKKGAGLKEIFDKTNVVVRIPNKEENCPTIQVIGEVQSIGDAITMIYKMANALTAVQIEAPQWMHSVVKGDRYSNLEIVRKNFPDVKIYFHQNQISIEGPPEFVEPVRSQIQTVIDDLRLNKTTYAEVEIDQQYYSQLIGKNSIRLTEIEDQTGCDIKFPPEGENRHVKLMGTQESVNKAREILLERVQKLANERKSTVSIDPQYYSQIIGAKGKKLEELRAKFHNIQIRFPAPDDKSDKVTLQGDKEDVDKCLKFLQQKIKDLYSVEFDVQKRLYPLLIGKAGSSIQRIRDEIPDVRVEVPTLDENSETFKVRLTGKKQDVDNAQKHFDARIKELAETVENSLELSITIDPKWHVRFFQNNRKLLIDLQKQFGDVTIKFPERKSQSDQVLLRGSKQNTEQVQKYLVELVEKWTNTITKEVSIPHRHHGYLLAQGGAYIQPIQKEFNVQIHFPTREKDSNGAKEDLVKITGLTNDVEQATVALEKMVPIETSIDIPYEVHGTLVGKNGCHLQPLVERYPDVQITFPPVKSTSNIIRFKGQAEQVEGFKKELLDQYEKYQADRQARAFEVHFTIKPEFRSLIFGIRRRNLNNLKQKHDVNILISDHSTPPSAVVPTPTPTSTSNIAEEADQQAIPHEQTNIGSEQNNSTEIEITIRGYEKQALACRDEILHIIEEFQSRITMEIEIDHRIHARIIGSGGQKVQQLMKQYNVEIKFPSNNQSDKVHVIGLDQDKIDSCIDQLLMLEDDFLQDLPQKQSTSNGTIFSTDQNLVQHHQQEVPSTNKVQTIKSTKQPKQPKQAPFKVKNAPWTSNDNNGSDDEDKVQDPSQQRNGHHHHHHHHHHQSPKKAPKISDRDEYPSFSSNSMLTTENSSDRLRETTVNTIPVIWGPSKRK